ncbi:MAG TPA: hypothetical protein VGM74_19340 [Burkholderiaceae bacterium]|jgi:hypothetical protein
MSNASASTFKPAANGAVVQPLLVEMFKATPAYLFVTALIAAFRKPAQR